MTVHLISVAPSQVSELLGFASPFIERAFASGMGDDTSEIVMDDLMRGASRLWIALGDQRILSVATTKIIDTAKKRLCVITCCSGNEVDKWVHFIRDIELYAAQNGCYAVRIMGRPGWKKMFPGYHEPWICLEKQLRT